MKILLLVIVIPACAWCFLQFGKRYPVMAHLMVPVAALGLLAAYGVGLLAGCEQPFCATFLDR